MDTSLTVDHFVNEAQLAIKAYYWNETTRSKIYDLEDAIHYLEVALRELRGDKDGSESTKGDN